MLADISPPDFETRIAILQTKAFSENMPLSDEVIVYIAKLITRDIRELQGALIKLHAYASLMKTSVTQGLAEEVLSKYFGDGSANIVDTAHVQKEVAKKFNVDVGDLKGKSRGREIVIPRQVAMYLARELTELSLPALGKVFGRDHSTVLHACRKVEEHIARDAAFAAMLTELSRRISGAR
jgi:chromosomal replication initiator protein